LFSHSGSTNCKEGFRLNFSANSSKKPLANELIVFSVNLKSLKFLLKKYRSSCFSCGNTNRRAKIESTLLLSWKKSEEMFLLSVRNDFNIKTDSFIDFGFLIVHKQVFPSAVDIWLFDFWCFAHLYIQRCQLILSLISFDTKKMSKVHNIYRRSL